MTRFYCIHEKRTYADVEFLRAACEARQIEFLSLQPNTYNFADWSEAAAGSCLYRVSVSEPAVVLEKTLISEHVATFYRDWRLDIGHGFASHYFFQKSGVPIPLTINYIGPRSPHLQAYVEQLGGFPIILKVLGGSHGVGVLKVDSWSSLVSVLDFARKDTQIILRKFVDVTASARLIVLGSQVVASIEYEAPAGDFRSNVGAQPAVAAKKFSPTVEAIATRAVKVVGLEFGGVDILIDEQERYYVTEVNFPCYFGRAQKITGIDIAGEMVDYLRTKSHAVSHT